MNCIRSDASSKNESESQSGLKSGGPLSFFKNLWCLRGFLLEEVEESALVGT
ncbi:hypothetical protein EV08_1992 [Prochlorococcus marinus str. SS2]|nr:hypothetical protein EV08_1992 [Prochlorococcus marinus str. SS2]